MAEVSWAVVAKSFVIKALERLKSGSGGGGKPSPRVSGNWNEMSPSRGRTKANVADACPSNRRILNWRSISV